MEKATCSACILCVGSLYEHAEQQETFKLLFMFVGVGVQRHFGGA
jgi:hypothetical protein